MKDERRFANSQDGETLLSRICTVERSRRVAHSRICFAAIPGCWPGRALPTSGCPQPGRPRSGCALGPFVPHAAHAPMGGLPYGQPSAPGGLRIRAYSSPLRGLLPAACSARPTPPSGLIQVQRGRVVSVRHARPAVHTLRAVVRSAAVTRSFVPVQSISQRGRQRHPASCHLAAITSYLNSVFRCTRANPDKAHRESFRAPYS